MRTRHLEEQGTCSSRAHSKLELRSPLLQAICAPCPKLDLNEALPALPLNGDGELLSSDYPLVKNSIRLFFFSPSLSVHRNLVAMSLGFNKPVVLDGRFNYLGTMCKFVQSNQECGQNENCRYSHSQEEVLVHPSRFKTELCRHPGCDNQFCNGAHGVGDLRSPVFDNGRGRRLSSPSAASYLCSLPSFLSLPLILFA